jgi:hypothetical protein
VGQDTVTRAEDGGDRSVGSKSCEGYTSLDPLGQPLGRIERIFRNRGGEPQYVRIRAGLFGNRLVLIPVLDVAVGHGLRTITLR